MKTTKLLTTCAVATALLPLTTLAAIDDQGMQYVSAAEGLHGSLRVNILKNVDKDTSDETTGGAKDSLRLWITGSGDIGNGWATTYYWEVRDGDPGNPGTIGTNAWTLGLKSPFGAFDFGRSAMVAPRMVPGGSLDTVAGGNAAHFACDVCDNTHRFESNSFNGFQIGISGVTNGDEGEGNGFTEDDLLDEYSFAMKYTSPVGFQVGAGYETLRMHDERFPSTSVYSDYDDQTGWRAGVRYGQDNWLLAYEYRTYEGFNDFGNLNTGAIPTALTTDVEVLYDSGNSTLTVTPAQHGRFSIASGGWFNDNQVGAIDALASVVASSNALDVITHLTATIASAVNPTSSLRPVNSAPNVDFYNKLSYQVQRAGIQVKFDRFTTSIGYSIATQELDLPGAIDIDQTAMAADAAYHLGLNSLIAVGWKRVKTETWASGGFTSPYPGINTALQHATRISRKQETTETTTQLYYRVDF